MLKSVRVHNNLSLVLDVSAGMPEEALKKAYVPAMSLEGIKELDNVLSDKRFAAWNIKVNFKADKSRVLEDDELDSLEDPIRKDWKIDGYSFIAEKITQAMPNLSSQYSGTSEWLTVAFMEVDPGSVFSEDPLKE